ncbi:hypothetical protein [Clostridium sp.]|uniref:hypothetical protein n=1 Tax=Clostridium sp. TaxID=1506 RepID=UPI0032171733
MFQSKLKEPALSQEMINIIEKSHRDGNGMQYDDIDRYKYLIMKMLTSNNDILKTLHNEELEKKIIDWENPNGDIYRNENIFDFLKIPDTQSKVKNFICFEVNDIEPMRYNENLIIKNIIFRTISHDEDYTTDWGISRQDLLAAIIKSGFDWTNIFGSQLIKINDKGKIAENGYYYREFVYEARVPNNLVNKAQNGGVSYRK